MPLNDKPLSRRRKRAYAAHRQQAENLAQQCAWWVRASIQEFERIKAQANENGDFHSLCWSSGELYRMQQAVPSALMGRFLGALRDSPENTVVLVDAGREDQQNAYAVTAVIVAMLATAAEASVAADA